MGKKPRTTTAAESVTAWLAKKAKGATVEETSKPADQKKQQSKEKAPPVRTAETTKKTAAPPAGPRGRSRPTWRVRGG